MPETERTDFSTPIPLRGNEIREPIQEKPNPYSRLEAVAKIRDRQRMLVGLLRDHQERPDVAELVDAIDELASELDGALLGDLRRLDELRRPGRQLERRADWLLALYGGQR